MKTLPFRQILTGAAVFALFASGWACKTGQSGSEETASAASGPHGPIDWKTMDADQRKKHMKEVVMPRMKAVFTTFNAEHYGEANCMLCHGEGAKEGKFDMPNPDLPPFSTDLFDESPEVAAFMKAKVLPTLAAALNLPIYDPATGEGEVSCMTCHPSQQ